MRCGQYWRCLNVIRYECGLGPARLRPGVAIDEVCGLVAAQAQLVRAAGYTMTDAADGDPQAPNEALAHVDDLLLERLEIEADANGRWPCFRVNVIGGNMLFPPEWRQLCWTMLLPPDAAATLGQWRSWYEQLVAGHRRHYLQRLFAHEIRHDMIDTQRRLGELAEQTRHRVNAWAVRPRHVEAREQILALPTVPPVPAPGPPPAAAADDHLVDGQREQIDALARHCDLLGQAVRAFDSTVPTRFKVRYRPRLPDAYAIIHDAWLEEFFAWTDDLAEDQGLYLWV